MVEKHGDKKRREILDSVLSVWANDPANLTVRQIAKKCGISHGGILYHFGSIDQLKHEAATLAVQTENSRVIAQLILTRHPSIAEMDEGTRRAHLIAAGS